MGGLYRTLDAGITWSRIEGPWGTTGSPAYSTVGRTELALSPSHPNVLYASIQVPPNGGSTFTGLLGLFRTDDAGPGATWTQIPTPPTGVGAYCGPNKCGYSHVITVDPADPNIMFGGGGTEGFWRCTSCGPSPTWTNVTDGTNVHPDHHALAWAASRLIDGNDGGVGVR